MDRPDSRPGLDRGQAIPVLLVVIGVVAALAIALAGFGAQLAAGERASSAADAAALAGVRHGRTVAAAIAAENGATLVGWMHRPAVPGDPASMVTVTVTVTAEGPFGTVTAVARADRAP